MRGNPAIRSLSGADFRWSKPARSCCTWTPRSAATRRACAPAAIRASRWSPSTSTSRRWTAAASRRRCNRSRYVPAWVWLVRNCRCRPFKWSRRAAQERKLILAISYFLKISKTYFYIKCHWVCIRWFQKSLNQVLNRMQWSIQIFALCKYSPIYVENRMLL